MNDQTAFRRVAAMAAIIAAPVALASWVLVLMAANFNPDSLASGMEGIITLGPPAGDYLYLAWKFADTFGYCLLLTPLAFFLWLWLKQWNLYLVTFCTLCGLACILIAAITVSAAGGAIPPLMRAYADAPGTERDVLLVIFQTVFNLLYYGIGPVSYLFGGVWWIGIGVVLRNERRILGIVTIVLGLVSLGVWLEQTFHIGSVFGTAYSLFVPIWALWLGLVIWRQAVQVNHVLKPAMDFSG